MKKIIFKLLNISIGLLFISCATSSPSTQLTPKSLKSEKTWKKTYGLQQYNEITEDAILLGNGDVIILANKKIGPLESKIVLLKINKYGSEIWQKDFGKKLQRTKGYALILGHNNQSLYIVGKRESMTEKEQAYLLKVSIDGNLINEKVFEKNITSELNSIVKIEDGYILAGNIEGENSKKNIFLIKLDKSDTIVWKKNQGFDGSNTYNTALYLSKKEKVESDSYFSRRNKTSSIYVSNVIVNSDNSIQVYGQIAKGKGVLNHPTFIKAVFSKNGTFNNFLLPEGVSGSGFYNDVKLVNNKITATGASSTMFWCKVNGYTITYERNTIGVGQGFSIDTVGNNFIVVGEVQFKDSDNYDLYLLKINNEGDKIWSKRYGGSENDTGEKVITLSDGGFLIVGTSRSYSGNAKADIFVLKVNSNGL